MKPELFLMKVCVVLAVSVLGCAHAAAQQNNTYSADSAVSPVAAAPNSDTISVQKLQEKYLKFTGDIGLNVSNFFEVNANPGPDKNALSGTGALNLALNYKKEGGRFEMTNEAHWTVDIEKAALADSSRIQRANDNLQTLHDYSIGFCNDNRISVNVIVKTTTSVFTIYSGNYFRDYGHAGRIQGFVNPYDISIAPGVKFSPDKFLRISVSPYSIDMYGLESQRIANTGLYTHDTSADGNHVMFVYKRLGAEVNIWYDRTIGTWLELQYRLGISSDYIEKIGKSGLLDGLFITKINLRKGLYLSYQAGLKGDMAQKVFKPDYSHTILLSYSKTF